jgi:hypothetical protein
MIRGSVPVKAAVLMEHFFLAGTPPGNYFTNWKVIV